MGRIGGQDWCQGPMCTGGPAVSVGAEADHPVPSMCIRRLSGRKLLHQRQGRPQMSASGRLCPLRLGLPAIWGRNHAAPGWQASSSERRNSGHNDEFNVVRPKAVTPSSCSMEMAGGSTPWAASSAELAPRPCCGQVLCGCGVAAGRITVDLHLDSTEARAQATRPPIANTSSFFLSCPMRSETGPWIRRRIPSVGGAGFVSISVPCRRQPQDRGWEASSPHVRTPPCCCLAEL